jgi:hypothetical protein
VSGKADRTTEIPCCSETSEIVQRPRHMRPTSISHTFAALETRMRSSILLILFLLSSLLPSAYSLGPSYYTGFSSTQVNCVGPSSYVSCSNKLSFNVTGPSAIQGNIGIDRSNTLFLLLLVVRPQSSNNVIYFMICEFHRL